VSCRASALPGERYLLLLLLQVLRSRNQPLRDRVNYQAHLLKRDGAEDRIIGLFSEDNLSELCLTIQSHPRAPNIEFSFAPIGEFERRLGVWCNAKGTKNLLRDDGIRRPSIYERIELLEPLPSRVSNIDPDSEYTHYIPKYS